MNKMLVFLCLLVIAYGSRAQDQDFNFTRASSVQTAYDASGVYTIPPADIPQFGQIARSAQITAALQDIAAALTYVYSVNTSPNLNASLLNSGTVNCARLPAYAGDVTVALGTCTTVLAAASITNAKLAAMPAATIKCNPTGGSAAAQDCTYINFIQAAGIGSPAGNLTFPIPSSGTTFTVNGRAASTVASFASPTGGAGTLSLANAGTADGDTMRWIISADAGSSQLGIFAAPAAQSSAIITNGPTGAQTVLRNLGSIPMVFGTANKLRMTINAAGGASIPAADSGLPTLVLGVPLGQYGLSVEGDGNQQYMARLYSSSATSGRNGLQFLNTGAVTQNWIIGNDLGASSSGLFSLRNVTAGTTPLTVDPTAGTLAVNATSGSHPFQANGSGTTSASTSQVYEPRYSVAALKDIATSESGTFTATYGGFSSPPGNTTISYTRSGAIVVIRCPSTNGSSNAANFSISGLPASITPATNQSVITVALFDNTGTLTVPGMANVSSSGSISFAPSAAGNTSGWTTSGAKGFAIATNVVYTLN